MKFLFLTIAVIILFFLNIFTGSVSISPSEVLTILFSGDPSEGPYSFIVLGSRLPQAVTALMAGAALTVSGLMLQSAFRNPLAGPSILGISSGAGLGVALVMLFLGGTISAGSIAIGGYLAVLAGALAGSLAIMALLLLFSIWLKSDLMLLIAGIMTGYLTSSLITLLNYFSSAESIQNYTLWGMGNFGGVSLSQLPVFTITIAVGLLMSVLLMKPLNVILLGENYARNLGIGINRVRNILLLTTGLLTAVVTAFCGPVSFIGLAVPHIVRLFFKTSDHRVIIPACMLTGAVTGLLCNLLCVLPNDVVLPLNAITPIIGVPVILYVIFKKR